MLSSEQSHRCAEFTPLEAYLDGDLLRLRLTCLFDDLVDGAQWLFVVYSKLFEFLTEAAAAINNRFSLWFYPIIFEPLNLFSTKVDVFLANMIDG